MNESQMKKLGYQIIDYIVEHRTNFEHKKVGNMGRHSDLVKIVAKDMPMDAEDPEFVFAEIRGWLDQYIMHTDHPRFYSFIPSPTNYFSVLADTLSIGYNVFAGHWLASSVAAMIEKQTIRWMNDLVGYAAESGGIFVSGGSMANMSALVLARDQKLTTGIENGTVYYSKQAHSSIGKALRILGFTNKNMRPIATDSTFRMITEELYQQIERDRKSGLEPFCIIGNAGTTNTGAIDDLAKLSTLANQYEMWLHIDAAYGGGALLSTSYRRKLDGLQLADSITLDPHKWWFQPYEMGCLLVKNQLHLKQSFAVNAEYLDDTTVFDENELNYYDYGMQLTRSFKALKLYAFFRCHGMRNIDREITEGIELAKYMQELLEQKPYWEIIAPATFGIVAFRANMSGDDAENDRINQELSDAINQDGYAMITTTKLNGKLTLRICPIHPSTNKTHLNETNRRMCTFIESGSIG